ncbi:MAG: EamA family transporter [Actinobacteria bacterium]|uniref:Unannotated protein n=1 Tax=freshwater metagenome TaxID=449393 RepID=A0A6J6EAE2_9ZZZZ|nr:EamA family transporter [Actinomycetota bacterium]
MTFSGAGDRISNHRHRDLVYLLIIQFSALITSPIVLAYEMDPLVVTFWRCILGGLFFLPLALMTQPKFYRQINRTQWVYMLVAALALAIHFITYMEGLYQVSLAVFYTILSTGTIWVGLISMLVFRQLLSSGQWAGLFAGFGGILLYAYSGHTFEAENQTSLLLLLTAAITFALYMVIGQKVRSTVSNFSYVVIVFLLAGAIALCYALVTDQSLTVTEPNDWVGILLITFFGQIVVHALTNLYLKHGQAAILQLTGLAKIPLIALIGWIFFGQAVSLAVIPALLLTIAGLVVYNMAQTKRS